MNEIKNYTRLISLKRDFMNWHVDDILYCAMNHLATVSLPDDGKKQVYLTVYKYRKNREMLCNLCDCTVRQLNDHLKKIIKQGLVTLGRVMKPNGEYVSAYLFPQVVEPPYQIVDHSMLWYVASTRNKSAFRVYVYLLNKSKWKEHYEFTNEELQIACGYSKDTKLTSGIFTNILNSFRREGILDYVEKTRPKINESGEGYREPYKELSFIAEHESELKK